MESIPTLTIKRLPKYLEMLYRLKAEGVENVSATIIAEFTNVHMTQVRRDIASTGLVGTPKVGHSVNDLIDAIEKCLNWNDISSSFLVGAGNLGRALLGYKELERKGLEIIAAFDVDESIINQKIHNIQVLHIDKLANLAKRLKVRIGILTVPQEKAQNTADLLVENNFDAIWNFTSVKLKVPVDIIVEDIDMSSSLAVISRRLVEKVEKHKK